MYIDDDNCIPDEYRGKLFLSVEDIQKILRVGRNSAYDYIKVAPFRSERIGNQIRINSFDFWKWYLGKK